MDEPDGEVESGELYRALVGPVVIERERVMRSAFDRFVAETCFFSNWRMYERSALWPVLVEWDWDLVPILIDVMRDDSPGAGIWQAMRLLNTITGEDPAVETAEHMGAGFYGWKVHDVQKAWIDWWERTKPR